MAEVVKDDHLVPLLQQLRCQHAADVARPSGYQNPHSALFIFPHVIRLPVSLSIVSHSFLSRPLIFSSPVFLCKSTQAKKTSRRHSGSFLFYAKAAALRQRDSYCETA
jgi:hypothetical protein